MYRSTCPISYFVFSPAHTKHLLFRTILHFSSRAFFISNHLMSLPVNFRSVCSLKAEILLLSSFFNFSPFPSTDPHFASSLAKAISNNFSVYRFGHVVLIASSLDRDTYTPLLEEPIRIESPGGDSTVLTTTFWLFEGGAVGAA